MVRTDIALPFDGLLLSALACLAAEALPPTLFDGSIFDGHLSNP
jgi:hypothetical protein